MTGDPSVTIHYNSGGPGGRPTARLGRDPHDWYIEPEFCVDLLLDVERFEGGIVDPAAGSGTIPRVCKRRGYIVHGSDMAERRIDGVNGGQNFLDYEAPPYLPNVVTNPPYQLAERFIRHALKVTLGKVAALVQAKFVYSQARYPLFAEVPLARIYFLSSRPSMPPGPLYMAGAIEAKGGSADYLWLTFDRAHTGPPTAHWLRKPARGAARNYDAQANGALGHAVGIDAMRQRFLAREDKSIDAASWYAMQGRAAQ